MEERCQPGSSQDLPVLLHLDLPRPADCSQDASATTARPSILVVGDGDLSYGAALTSALGSNARILVTGLESAADVRLQHPSSEQAAATIAQHGGVVMHGVDSTCLHEKALKHEPFSRVVWLFPQSPQWRRIDRHRALLRDFFTACADASVLSPCGRIYMTLLAGQGGTRAEPPAKMRRPGDTWQLVECAATAGFVLIDVRPAQVDQLQSYGYSPKGLRGQDRTFLGSSSGSALLHILQRDCGSNSGAKLKENLQFDPPVYTRDICFWLEPATGESLAGSAACAEDFNEAFADLARRICARANADSVEVSLFDEGYVDPGTRRIARGYRLVISATCHALPRARANALVEELRAAIAEGQLVGASI